MSAFEEFITEWFATARDWTDNPVTPDNDVEDDNS